MPGACATTASTTPIGNPTTLANTAPTCRSGIRPRSRRAGKAGAPVLDDAVGVYTPDPEQQSAENETALAYAKCMRAHGLDWPDPIFTEGGGMNWPEDFNPNFDDRAVEEADTVCIAETWGTQP